MTARRPLPAPELRVFGVPAAVARAGDARLALKRAVALLAYLGFAARPVPRAHLAALLWPDADQATGRTRLRRLAWTIEQVLGDDLLAAEGDTLALPAQALEIDALAFARFARTAVAGPALDDATLTRARDWCVPAGRPLMQGLDFGSEAFDDWVKAVSIEHEQLLARLLERLVDELGRRGEFASAREQAEALLALDPFREPSYVRLMQLHALQGDAAGVEAAYLRCAECLRAEFGIRPGPRTEAAWLRLSESLKRPSPNRAETPGVRYALGELGAVAYTVLGEDGPALVIAPGFVSHIEIALAHPRLRALLESLAARCRVVLFDRRGVGLSERLGVTSTPAALASDIAAILDHEGIDSTWLFASSEGGLGAMRLAIDAPRRVAGLCLFGSLAKGSAASDYPWALPASAYDVWLQRLVAGWGGPVGIETFAPSAKDDPAERAWWARLVRHAASPGGLAAILGGLRDADLRADLHRIAAPTLVMHRRGDRAVRFEAGEHLASRIPGATWAPLDGVDHFWWIGDSTSIVDAILAFVAR